MLTSLQLTAIASAGCEIRSDALTRQLYATDASHYRIEPGAVAFPRTTQEAAKVLKAAIEQEVPVSPRGAGSGLAGGALGDGLVIDFSLHNRAITQLDVERRTVRASAGVVLDNLNSALRPHGLCFGPDVATSSRATIGGMIANNSSGARTRLYGTTADHVLGIECVLADGRIVTSGSGAEREMSAVTDVVRRNAGEIQKQFPAGLLKRWPGYGLDRCVESPSLQNILSGSEGTLGAITSAVLNLVPLPTEKGLGLIFFSSVAEATQATVELLGLEPAAIEHIDDVLTDQTRGQRQFQAARDLMDLDAHPCKSILIVEFFDQVPEKLRALEHRSLGLRTKCLSDAKEMNLVWSVRSAGLALLTGRKGRAKPVTCIEDTAVRPRDLPEYVAGLQSILGKRGVEACFYGHAASGLLHVRPVLDLHSAEDLRKFREISDEVSALVRQFKGSLAAEHGVGIARTEYMLDQIGAPLLDVTRTIKRTFDPQNLLNPGKIVGDCRFSIDTNLRSESTIAAPYNTLAFTAKDESFLANLEQCNGCGGCRKPTPTMCPTFAATGEEVMSTRGRANVIRAVLEGHLNEKGKAAMAAVLSHCLSCKACAAECPSNVNLPLLKAEMLHAKHRQEGMSLRTLLISRIDLLGSAGSIAPSAMNRLLESKWFRKTLHHLVGLAEQRPLPLYAEERFDHWFDSRNVAPRGTRGRVLLWDDCFVRHNEPNIGKAAVKVLESAGYEVALPRGRRCCGRPAFSQGNLDEAAQSGRHNIEMLAKERRTRGFEAIVFLEPSCYSMFAEDYAELRLSGAREVAARSVLFEHFVEEVLARDPKALMFQPTSNLAIHAHCHAKALTDTSLLARLANRLPGRATLLNTGCCGMAGAFGAIAENYELSLKVAEPLAEQIKAQAAGTRIVASGTSCRQQIEHVTGVRAAHMAEVLAGAVYS